MTNSPHSLARTALIWLGAKVEDIPTSVERTADFLTSFGDTTVLIEEKQIEDSVKYLNECAHALPRGEIHQFTVPIVRNNRLSRLIRYAKSQIVSSSHLAHDFRLVWLTCTGGQAEAMFKALIATVYGQVQIAELGSPDLRPCYYFRNSDFYRDSDVVDGVVAAYVEEKTLKAKLCLNSLSPNYSAIRKSEVVQAFRGCVEDPVVNEAEGRAYVLDAPIDRENEAALLKHLREKYSTGPLQTFGLGYLGAMTRAP